MESKKARIQRELAEIEAVENAALALQRKCNALHTKVNHAQSRLDHGLRFKAQYEQENQNLHARADVFFEHLEGWLALAPQNNVLPAAGMKSPQFEIIIACLYSDWQNSGIESHYIVPLRAACDQAGAELDAFKKSHPLLQFDPDCP